MKHGYPYPSMATCGFWFQPVFPYFDMSTFVESTIKSKQLETSYLEIRPISTRFHSSSLHHQQKGVLRSCLSNVTSNALDKDDGYSFRCVINIPANSVEPSNVTLSFHNKTVGETETTDENQPLTVKTTLTGIAKKENITQHPVENVAVSPSGPYLKGHTVRCTADGHPPPTFKWTNLKSGDVVDNDTLVITGDDGDNYTCTATNTFKGTEVSKSITIEVSSPPPPSPGCGSGCLAGIVIGIIIILDVVVVGVVIFSWKDERSPLYVWLHSRKKIAVQSQIEKGPTNALKKVGDSVTLECVTVRKNCDQVEWQKVEGLQSPKLVYRNGIGMLNNDLYPTRRYSVNSTGGCNLTITQLEINDSGRFICLHVVDSGEETRTSILVVIDPVENIAASLLSGNDGTVRCTADGHPPPTFKWTHLKSGDVVDGDTLVITGDAGDEYTCTATNTVKGRVASQNITIEFTSPPPEGIMWQSGDTWKGVRKCAFGAMTGCGVGDKTLEERIQHETNKLIKEFCKREEDGCPFYPMELIHKGVTNILSSIIFGCRYKYKSTQFQKFICMIRTNVLDSTTFFPILASLPVPRLKKAVKNMNELICHVEEEIVKHKENFDPACIRDFIDLYLKEVSAAGFLKKDDVCKQQMEVAIIDLFVCGSEPTSAALAWAILCMVAFPDIQAKCHEDNVVCGDRLPELCDLRSMPYVQATLREVLRRFTVLPLGIPHGTHQDVGLSGYCIPSNTIVICNLQAIHLNDSYWNSPCEFDPERFLDDDEGDCGKSQLVDKERYVSFGIGPGSCIGTELAWNIMFLVFTELMQRFDFQRGCDCDLTKCFEGKYRSTFSPLPYKIKIRCHCV